MQDLLPNGREHRGARVGRDRRTMRRRAAICSSASNIAFEDTASPCPYQRLRARRASGARRVKESLREKLTGLVERYEEVGRLLSDAGRDRRQGSVPRAVEGVRAARASGRGLRGLSAARARHRSVRGDADRANEPSSASSPKTSCASSSSSATRASARCSRISSRRIPTTTRTCSSRSAPGPAATKRRSSRAICSGCTAATPSGRAGASRS